MKATNSFFSHIYVERNILQAESVQNILNKFKNSEIILITHYKDVFSKRNQNYVLQKQNPNLIIANKKDNFVYKGAKVCDDFGNDNFYYTTNIMNCFYDCEYCYLQGMYSSGNVVVFVNIEDVFVEVKKLLEKLGSLYLCVSYDTDLLAFEKITKFCEKWISFGNENKNLTIEIRTKSNNFKSISLLKPSENIILAWTLSPDKIISKYENNTPSLNARLSNIKMAIEKNYLVRVCFDPVLYIENWQEEYLYMIQKVFKEIDFRKIKDVSIGTFRVSKDYLKTMRKQRNNSLILNYPFETVNGICSYNIGLSKEMIDFVYKNVNTYVPKEKIFCKY